MLDSMLGRVVIDLGHEEVGPFTVAILEIALKEDRVVSDGA